MLADLFPDVREDSTEDRPRRRICRLCAVEVFLWGLKDWWVRERRKGYVEPSVVNRKDCPEGRNCSREADYGKSFFPIEFQPLIQDSPSLPAHAKECKSVPKHIGASLLI